MISIKLIIEANRILRRYVRFHKDIFFNVLLNYNLRSPQPFPIILLNLPLGDIAYNLYENK